MVVVKKLFAAVEKRVAAAKKQVAVVKKWVMVFKISCGFVEKFVATVEKVDCSFDQKINRSGWIISRSIVKNLLALVKKFVAMVEKSRVGQKSRDMVKN